MLPNSEQRRRKNWSEHWQLVSTYTSQRCVYNDGSLSEASPSQQNDDTRHYYDICPSYGPSKLSTTTTGTRKYDHITPVLRELHWLPITSRIQYKVTLLVYKTLHGPAPQYLQDLIQYRSARPGLRSAGILLNVPMTRSVTYGDRAFCSIGPTWWNSLPSELKTSPSVDSFKRNLKTHLFKLAYGQ